MEVFSESDTREAWIWNTGWEDLHSDLTAYNIAINAKTFPNNF